MPESQDISEELEAALSEMQRIRSRELPKESHKEMVARIQKQFAEEEREE